MDAMALVPQAIPDGEVRQHISTCLQGLAVVEQAAADKRQTEADKATIQVSNEAVVAPSTLSDSSKSLAAKTTGKTGVVAIKVASIDSKQEEKKRKEKEDKKKKRAEAAKKTKSDLSSDEAAADSESSH